ncbi:testisin [Carassius auratus]|uniref:Testisin n=1 Tax=Carassius auratus TaxID=7957 RepID=A0A6P6MEP0_CARAU|nr:testisin-like [Carassius auratus]
MWKTLALLVCVQVCAHGPMHPRTEGGVDAPKKEFPWMVSLHDPTCHFCGGSLINKEWVLSAAHCFFSINDEKVNKDNIRVYLGKMTQREKNKKELMLNVKEIYTHNQYNATTIDNDIALLHLLSPVEFNNYISPVCLVAQGSNFRPGTKSKILGWGLNAAGENLPYPGTLQEAEVDVVDINYCRNQLSNNFPCVYHQITNNMICAGVPAGGVGPNMGDSGGPIMSQHCSRWVQFGITSWGIGCGRPDITGVYTDVSQYQRWITDTIQNQDPYQDLPQFVDLNSQCTKGSEKQNKMWKWCCCK